MSRSIPNGRCFSWRRCGPRLHLPRKKEGPARLTVQRIFGASEFEPEHLAIRWLADSSGYVTLEPSSDRSGGRDLVSHDPASGDRRVLVSAADLTPPDESSPLSIEEYAFSRDRSRLLVFTNSKRVWRANTRGDYWVLDRAGRELRKLGRRRAPASLMHAKFAPSGLAGCLCPREQHLCGRSGRWPDHDADEFEVSPTRSTAHSTGSTKRSWSARRIPLEPGRQVDRLLAARHDGAFRSFPWSTIPTASIRESPRSSIPRSARRTRRAGSVSYPRPAEQPSGSTVPGDPRDNYIAYLEWAGNSHELVLQQFNRHQNTVPVMLAETGRVENPTAEPPDASVPLLSRPRHPSRLTLSMPKRSSRTTTRPGSIFKNRFTGFTTVENSCGSANATAGGIFTV